MREIRARHSTVEVIPKIIHFINIGGGNLPIDICKNIDDVSAMNPGWSVTIWCDREIDKFITEHYGDNILRIYHSIDRVYGAARADFFRYLCVYRLGGIYLDLKSATTRPVDTWLSPTDEYILAQWDNEAGQKREGWGLHPDLVSVKGGEFVQWFLVSRPEHPFLRAVCELVTRRIIFFSPFQLRYGRAGVLRTTGPIPYTLGIAPILNLHKHKRIDIEDDNLLKYSIFEKWDGHHLPGSIHYSNTREPVVVLGVFGYFLFRIFRSIKWRLNIG